MDINTVKGYICEYRALGMERNEILKALHQDGIHIELVKQALNEVNALFGAAAVSPAKREVAVVLPTKQVITMDLNRVKTYILSYRQLGMDQKDILRALRADNVDASMIAQALKELNAAPAPVAAPARGINLAVVNEKIKTYTNNYQNVYIARNMGPVKTPEQHEEIALALTERLAHTEKYAI